MQKSVCSVIGNKYECTGCSAIRQDKTKRHFRIEICESLCIFYLVGKAKFLHKGLMQIIDNKIFKITENWRIVRNFILPLKTFMIHPQNKYWFYKKFYELKSTKKENIHTNIDMVCAVCNLYIKLFFTTSFEWLVY